MNSATRALLEQHFDAAFAAPVGIKKLRELILMLAMQGKLVPQDPSDPPASQLLKEIAAEKKRLVKEGKIKVPKPLPAIEPKEMPYLLPNGWEWVRLGEIGVWKSGSTPSRNNSDYYGGDIPWVKSGEVKQGHIAKSEELITDLALKECSLSLNPVGSVLVAMYGANIGEVGILDIEATTNQAVCACRTYTAFDEQYLLSLIASLKPYFISQGAGAAQPNISREKIVATPFPLPPLPEQRRIVAKIDQLMTRCDELERLRAEREQKRRSVHAAALKQLLEAQATDTIASAWQFISQHFGDLYAVKENVAELRKAILQLAVMGKLVPQNPNDPPASQLLKEIEAEKKRLVKEGKIKAPKTLPEVTAAKMPHPLPRDWEWVRFGEVANTRLGKMLDKSKNRGNPKRYLRNTNVQWHRFELNDVKEMKFEQDELDEFRVLSGDLLICEGGEPGRCAIWQAAEMEMYFQKAIHRARPFVGVISEYLQVCLSNDAGNGNLNQYFTGATIKHFPGDKLSRYVIPLPCVNEQQRIVTKVNHLMALCDTLDQTIDAATSKQTELLNALMAPII